MKRLKINKQIHRKSQLQDQEHKFTQILIRVKYNKKIMKISIKKI